MHTSVQLLNYVASCLAFAVLTSCLGPVSKEELKKAQDELSLALKSASVQSVKDALKTSFESATKDIKAVADTTSKESKILGAAAGDFNAKLTSLLKKIDDAKQACETFAGDAGDSDAAKKAFQEARKAPFLEITKAIDDVNKACDTAFKPIAKLNELLGDFSASKNKLQEAVSKATDIGKAMSKADEVSKLVLSEASKSLAAAAESMATALSTTDKLATSVSYLWTAAQKLRKSLDKLAVDIGSDIDEKLLFKNYPIIIGSCLTWTVDHGFSTMDYLCDNKDRRFEKCVTGDPPKDELTAIWNYFNARGIKGSPNEKQEKAFCFRDRMQTSDVAAVYCMISTKPASECFSGRRPAAQKAKELFEKRYPK